MSDSDTDRESATFFPAENDDDTKAATTAYPPHHHKENTEVLYGEENVINWVVQTLHTVTKTLDLCIDRNSPSILLFNERYGKSILKCMIGVSEKGCRRDHQGKRRALQKDDAVSRAETS